MTKCSNCKTRIKEGIKTYRNGIYIFDNSSCRDEFISKQKEKAKKQQAKKRDEDRKVKKREKKENSITYLIEKLDNLWSELVKIEYNYTCQYCGKTRNNCKLNSHHLFTRSRMATRFDLDNGICLCSYCHTLSSNFSAHQTILEFAERIRELKGDDFINELSKKSKEIKQYTSEELKELIQIYTLKLKEIGKQ